MVWGHTWARSAIRLGGKMQWSSNEAHQRGVITFPICLFLRVTFQLVASFADRLHLTKPRTWEGLNARSKYFLERRRSPAVIEFGSHHEPHDDGLWQHLQHCVCAQLPQRVLGMAGPGLSPPALWTAGRQGGLQSLSRSCTVLGASSSGSWDVRVRFFTNMLSNMLCL